MLNFTVRVYKIYKLVIIRITTHILDYLLKYLKNN
jgi:hypothetical protein